MSAAAKTNLPEAPLGGHRLRWPKLIQRRSFFVWVVGLFVGTQTLLTGLGSWEVPGPLAWSWGVTTWMWWLGIIPGGAVLLAATELMSLRWRGRIHRPIAWVIALAALNALGYGVALPGRPGRVHWLLPNPTATVVWPQLQSPIIWTLAAMGALLVALGIFAAVLAIPAWGRRRDGATDPRSRRWLALLALGWRGAATDWIIHRAVRRMLAGIILALALCAGTMLSFVTATSGQPPWHSTLAPVAFIATGTLSAAAIIMLVTIPRSWAQQERVTRARHLDTAGWMVLIFASLTAYVHLVEQFLSALGDGARPSGNVLRPPLLFVGLGCAAVLPHALWRRSLRRRPGVFWAVALCIALGTWMLLLVLVLQRRGLGYAPLALHPTSTDGALLLTSVSLLVLGTRVLERSAEARGSPTAAPQTRTRESKAVAGGTPVVVAEFANARELTGAVKNMVKRKYRRLETYTPYPVEEVLSALAGDHPPSVMRWVFMGGAGGAMLGALLQWQASLATPWMGADPGSFPLTTAGIDPHAPLVFVPLALVTMLLCAAITTLGLFVVRADLFRFWRPIFDVEGGEGATGDRFFLQIQPDQRKRALATCLKAVQSLRPLRVVILEGDPS